MAFIRPLLMLQGTEFLSKLLIIILISGLSIFGAQAKNGSYLYVLGVGQDAGYPQAGCFQPHCMPGWEDKAKGHGATSLALVVPNSGKKYIFEATPNFPQQFYQLELQAPSSRFTLGGIFVTHAHIGHYAGLMFLGREAMGASSVPVFVMPKMRSFLQSNGPWSQLVKLRNIVLEPLKDKQLVELGTVSVTPFLVPHRDEYSETVGFQIKGQKKSAIFIPDINKWQDWQTSLSQLVLANDYLLIDATFYADGELPGRDMSKIPHPFASESMALLNELPAKQKSKIWFIHMNHTNPLLDLDSRQSMLVKAQGFNIAYEGLILDL